MKEKTYIQVEKIAKSVGFHTVARQKVWKGFDVYKCIFTDGLTHYTGYTQYSLVKNGKVQLAKGDRCMEIMDYQYKH